MKKRKLIFIIVGSILYMGILAIIILTYTHIRQIADKLKEPPPRTAISQTMDFPEQDKINKIYLSLSEKNIKASEAILSSVRWFYVFVGGILGLVFTFLGFIGIKYAAPSFIKNQISEWIDKDNEIKELKKDLGITSREANVALAWIYLNKGLEYYYNPKKKIDKVIGFTEKALCFIKSAYQTIPDNNDALILWGMIHGNLSYYYTEKGDTTNYKAAIKYANEALSIGETNKIANLIDDYIFTIVYFDVKDGKELSKARKIFMLWKDALEKEILTLPEDKKVFDDYKKFFDKIKKEEE